MLMLVCNMLKFIIGILPSTFKFTLLQLLIPFALYTSA